MSCVVKTADNGKTEELSLAKSVLDRVRCLHSNLAALGKRGDAIFSALSGGVPLDCGGSQCPQPSYDSVFYELMALCDEMEGIVAGMNKGFDTL